MTASLRGLFACTALLVLAAAWWVFGGPAAPPSPLLWQAAPQKVQELSWPRADGALVIVRDEGRWRVQSPAPGLAVAARVDEWLSSLAAARWHRRAAPERAGAILGRVLVDGEPIEVGQEVGEQQWVTSRGKALLVDRWLARLLLDGDRLRDRRVFPGAERAPVVALHGAAAWRTAELVIGGVAEVSPSRRSLDPARLAALRGALAAMEVELGRAPAPDATFERFTLRVAGGPEGEAELWGGGECPGAPPAVAARSSRLGAVCIASDALLALGALIDATSADDALDLRPLAAAAPEIVALSLGAPGGEPAITLERAGGAWRVRDGAATSPVDAAAVASLVEELTAPWQLAPLGPEPPRAELRLRRRDGSEGILDWGRGARGTVWVRRRGEPARLASVSARELATREALDLLRDRTMWQLEPSAVQRVVIDGKHAARGAVLSEWLSEEGVALPAPTADALESLVMELASLRSLGAAGAATTRGAAVRLELRPPPGRSQSDEPSAFEVRLALTAKGCAASLPARREAISVARALCDSAAAAGRLLRGR